MLMVITGWEKSLHEFSSNYSEQSTLIIGVVWASSSAWGKPEGCGEQGNIPGMVLAE